MTKKPELKNLVILSLMRLKRQATCRLHRKSSNCYTKNAMLGDRGNVVLVGIQKHFMVVEIPGFDLSNWLSDLTTSLFSSDGIGKLIFNKVK